MTANIEEQIAEVVALYPTLIRETPYKLVGLLSFDASYQGKNVKDAFTVEITIPTNYPIKLPSVKEKGKRMTGYGHLNNNTGDFCLGAPLAVRKKFNKEPTLLAYIQQQIIPFMFSFCVFQETGKMPYDELSHFGEGILEFYQREFNIDDKLIILLLLKINVENNYERRSKCPCRSGKILHHCHGRQIKEIARLQTRKEYLYDFFIALKHFCRTTNQIFPNDFWSTRLSNAEKDLNLLSKHEANNR